MDCATLLRKYSRYILVIFNFLFVLTGILLVAVGASVKAYYHEYGRFLEDKYIYASDLVIAVGVIIFVIAFFGCCGALKENACMTLTFSVLLIIILILEIIVGISGILLKNKADEVIDKALSETLTKYNTPNETEITKLWDQVQIDFHCCGIYNYTDWSLKTNTTNGQVPISCCKFPSGSSGEVNCSPDKPDYIHKKGCLTELSDYIEDHAASIEGVGLGLAILQLLGIVLSCYLSKQIKSDYETV